MDRARWLAEKRAEVARLDVRISEVTPSRRDFELYVATQRRELAVIARLERAGPHAVGSPADSELIAHAQACDDAEVAAIAVATDARRGGSLRLLRAVAEATQAPVLRDDLILDPSQLYDARLHGADAAIFPAAELEANALAELARVASSLHMASVIETRSPADLAKALGIGRTLIGLNADLETLLELARAVPPNRTVIALRDPATRDDVRRLQGRVDAVVVGALLLESRNIAATIAEIASAPSPPGECR